VLEKEKIKILHVLYSGLGGHGNVFFSMLDADTKNDFVFEALFNGVEPVRAEYIERCAKKNITWSYVPKKPGLHIGYYFKLYRQIKKSKPQVIFLHGGAAAIPARLAKITTGSIKKIIVRETQANHLKTKIDWVYLATAMLMADKLVYLSNGYKMEVKRKLSFLYSEKRTAVIPNGINLDTFTMMPMHTRQSPLVLGMQSRLIAIKDHITLLHAFARLVEKQTGPALQLLIAGDGAYKETLGQLAHTLNISDKVVFTGMLEEPELVDFLHKLDIYIHASLGETMSTAIMQAMACGKPIVASDVMGIHNMIENGVTGILVPVKDAGRMADAIALLINDSTLSNKLALNAFNFATANYSNGKMLENYKMLFTD